MKGCGKWNLVYGWKATTYNFIGKKQMHVAYYILFYFSTYLELSRLSFLRLYYPPNKFNVETNSFENRKKIELGKDKDSG